MRQITLPLTILMLTGVVSWLFVRQDAFSQTAPVAEKSPYTTGEASKDGIGKFFHGREIAQVMGHPGIGWLERDEREQEEAPPARSRLSD